MAEKEPVVQVSCRYWSHHPAPYGLAVKYERFIFRPWETKSLMSEIERSMARSFAEIISESVDLCAWSKYRTASPFPCTHSVMLSPYIDQSTSHCESYRNQSRLKF